MKIPKFLVFSFFIFAFTAISFERAIDAQPPKDAVIDSNDNEVLIGFDYYIAVTSPFDGMSIANEASCPPPVVRRNNLSLLPIKISSVVDSNDNVVREDTNINLEFNIELNSTTCNVPPIWKVEFNASMLQWLVTIGGDRSHNRFQIARSCPYRKYFYQLRYCPSLRSIQFPCVTVCSFFKDGLNYLALNGDPIPIVLGQLASVSST
ncbi:unnamed protein product [Dovyalis caffra]|uniref:Uncharacterized protein n=1 Tax=Dovyalis caffra TaxID=77055 RepID=A0AAV1SHF2_9ROSI|nr:unnamed protein product [Dovyalis caffra]